MNYFFYSNHVSAQDMSGNFSGNYALHLWVDSREGMNEEMTKKLATTYFKFSGVTFTNTNETFFDKKIVFESLEKLKDFILLYLKDHSLDKGYIVSMANYNQALSQSQHISQLLEKIDKNCLEIQNPEFNEKRSLLGKLFN